MVEADNTQVTVTPMPSSADGWFSDIPELCGIEELSQVRRFAKKAQVADTGGSCGNLYILAEGVSQRLLFQYRRQGKYCGAYGLYSLRKRHSPVHSYGWQGSRRRDNISVRNRIKYSCITYRHS